MFKLLQYTLLLSSILLSSFLRSDVESLFDTTMDQKEFLMFQERVGKAVADHPEFKVAQDNLIATYASLKGAESALRPQFRVLIDSNNAISRKYREQASNLVERSQADHKTNVRFTINQLLYDFGATGYEVSRNESLTKASRAELTNKVLELIFLSIKSYIDVAAYNNFVTVVEESYLRHKAIKERIKQRVASGLSAGRELSRAEAREAEAFAKLTSVRQNLGVAISKFRIYFPTGNLPTKIPFHPDDFANVSMQTSQSTMLSRNPLILQANEQLRASKFRTKNVNAASLPRLDLELKKQHYNVTKESDEFDFYSGVNFSYDIYTGGRKEALKEQAKAEESATQNDRDALLQKLISQLRESVKNLNLLPDRLSAYRNAYLANKKSQFFAQEEFRTSNALLLDLLQTERDFLDASESLIETLRSSEIQKYSYLQLIGELGDTFQIILD